jgi:predicted enzyme related to lactoylglutathione lyase
MDQSTRTWWHELNTWEPESALAFYGRTLGWEFQDAELPDGSEYWIASKEGSPVGGVFGLKDPDYNGIPSHWMTYMAVPDISQAERATLNAGGEVMRPATHIAGVGKLAVVSDASGALIGLIQPESGHASAQSLPH